MKTAKLNNVMEHLIKFEKIDGIDMLAPPLASMLIGLFALI